MFSEAIKKKKHVAMVYTIADGWQEGGATGCCHLPCEKKKVRCSPSNFKLGGETTGRGSFLFVAFFSPTGKCPRGPVCHRVLLGVVVCWENCGGFLFYIQHGK